MRFIVLGIFCVFLAACSTRQLAGMAADYNDPTGYEERSEGFLGIEGFGYRDRKISEGVYKVSFRGNLVTSLERAKMMVTYRAAKIGRSQGFTHFSAGRPEAGVGCNKKVVSGAVAEIWVFAEQVVTFGTPDTLSRKTYPVEEIISEFEAAALTARLSEAEEKRVYAANLYSCRTETLVTPEAVPAF